MQSRQKTRAALVPRKQIGTRRKIRQLHRRQELRLQLRPKALPQLSRRRRRLEGPNGALSCHFRSQPVAQHCCPTFFPLVGVSVVRCAVSKPTLKAGLASPLPLMAMARRYYFLDRATMSSAEMFKTPSSNIDFAILATIRILGWSGLLWPANIVRPSRAACAW